MTFSIIAFDEGSNELGAAVASNLFGITTRSLFARSGVGIVVSQMLCEPTFGMTGLDMLEKRERPIHALAEIVGGDPGRETRQLVVMNAAGEIAAHTGARCVQYAAHLVGEHFSVQGALVKSENVLSAVANSFTGSSGALGDRLVAALRAGEKEGGDLRGSRAAGLRIVAAKPHASWLENHPVDVRVDDHAKPVDELARLYRAQKPVVASDIAFDRGLAGDMPGAFADFARLESEYSEDVDVALRYGILLAFAGDPQGAAIRLRRVARTHSGWKETLSRLPAAGFLPDDPMLFQALAL